MGDFCVIRIIYGLFGKAGILRISLLGKENALRTLQTDDILQIVCFIYSGVKSIWTFKIYEFLTI